MPNNCTADLSSHPAVVAWLRLHGSFVESIAVQPISLKPKSQVYRLTGAGPEGEAIIAKRCKKHAAVLESAIYTRILSAVPISRLKLHGVVEDEDKCAWLFLEDAGDGAYDIGRVSHRRLASAWLALLHAAVAESDARTWLPDRGPDTYRQHLWVGRDNITAALQNANLKPRQRDVLIAMSARCEWIDSRWDQLLAGCAKFPSTLVHGDFAPKNLRVRAGAERQLLVMDWEAAGWGLPARDLAHCPDMDLYRNTVQASLPALDEEALRRLVHVGTVFRLVDSITWSSWGLEWPSNQGPFTDFETYEAEFRAITECAGL